MYRMFGRIPKGLEPMADIFKCHVEGEGMKLVKVATEAGESRREKEGVAGGKGGAAAAKVEGGSSSPEQVRGPEARGWGAAGWVPAEWLIF